MRPIAFINVEKRTLEFAEPIKWHTPTVVNLDRIPLFTKEALAQPEQERPADCERCNRLEEQAYDLVGKLRVAKIKLSMHPQRPWVGLTDEDCKGMSAGDKVIAMWANRILKEKNGA